MASPIDRFSDELWDNCVIRLAADDDATADRWDSDNVAFIREGFFVQPMPDSLRPLMDEALAAWQVTEDRICARLGLTREQFISLFEKIREDYLSGRPEWYEAVLPLANAVYGKVRNLDWVSTFSWILPAADPKNIDSHRATGRTVTAVFYIELLSKFRDAFRETADFQRVDARWRLASQG